MTDSEQPRTIEQLAVAMQEIADRDEHDAEIDHSDADDLLCDAVMLLGPEGKRMVELWAELDKWYA